MEELNDQNTETPTPAPLWEMHAPLQSVVDISSRAKQEMHKVIIGQDAVLDQMLVALLIGGHVLLEGVPGIAKTQMAKMLAKTLSVGFSRLQFTPDLMPTDVLGTNVFNVKTSEFIFNKGPVFSNIVLIDEINRAPAKTQSALFEVMEERQVTIDGTTYPLEAPFMVAATQNPVEQEGTYKLPEAQLDRFFFRIMVDYPSLHEETQILNRFQSDFSMAGTALVEAIIQPSELANARQAIEQVNIRTELVEYIAKIIVATRSHSDIYLGASPRASLSVLRAAKAKAALSARDFVIPEDIQWSLYPVLNHRLILMPEREMEGLQLKTVLQDIIAQIEVPR